MKPFYIGLSCLSNGTGLYSAEPHNNPGETAAREKLRTCTASLPPAAGPESRPAPATPPRTEARRILALLDAELSGRAEPAALAVEKGGRPFFVDHHADFNISHSRRIAAVVWSEAVNPANGLPLRTGCDVQHISPVKSWEAVARNYYSPGENSYIGAAKDAAAREQRGQTIRFYRIWVLKECYLKAKGLSVADMRTAPSFADRDGLVKEAPVPFNFFLYELGGGTAEQYLLAVCRETAGTPSAAPRPEIRWFSTKNNYEQTQTNTINN